MKILYSVMAFFKNLFCYSGTFEDDPVINAYLSQSVDIADFERRQREVMRQGHLYR